MPTGDIKEGVSTGAHHYVEPEWLRRFAYDGVRPDFSWDDVEMSLQEVLDFALCQAVLTFWIEEEKGFNRLPDAASLVKSLLERGASVSSRNGSYGAYCHALWTQTEETIRIFLERGASIDYKDEFGLTPLMIVVRSLGEDRLPKLKVLLEYGADVNEATSDGRTALMLAADNASSMCHGAGASHKRDISIIRLLLESGAEVNARNRHGQTALAIATENMYTKPGKRICIQRHFEPGKRGVSIFSPYFRQNRILTLLQGYGAKE